MFIHVFILQPWISFGFSKWQNKQEESKNLNVERKFEIIKFISNLPSKPDVGVGVQFLHESVCRIAYGLQQVQRRNDQRVKSENQIES